MAQQSAIDEDQQAYQARKTREREARVSWLWRELLKKESGRQFVWECLLADVGYDQPMRDLESHPHLLAQVAYYNLAVRWLNQHIRRHPDLYRHMVDEAARREENERKEEDTKRAGWDAREES